MVSVENQKSADPDKPQDVFAGMKNQPIVDPNAMAAHFKSIFAGTKNNDPLERNKSIIAAANLLESGLAKFKTVLAPDIFEEFSRKMTENIYGVMNSEDDHEVIAKFQEIYLRLFSMQRESIKNDYELISAPNPRRVIRAAREIVLRDLNYDSAQLQQELKLDEQQSKEAIDFLKATGLSSELLKNLANLKSKIKPKTETSAEKTVIVQKKETAPTEKKIIEEPETLAEKTVIIPEKEIPPTEEEIAEKPEKLEGEKELDFEEEFKRFAKDAEEPAPVLREEEKLDYKAPRKPLTQEELRKKAMKRLQPKHELEEIEITSAKERKKLKEKLNRQELVELGNLLKAFFIEHFKEQMDITLSEEQFKYISEHLEDLNKNNPELARRLRDNLIFYKKQEKVIEQKEERLKVIASEGLKKKKKQLKERMEELENKIEMRRRTSGLSIKNLPLIGMLFRSPREEWVRTQSVKEWESELDAVEKLSDAVVADRRTLADARQHKENLQELFKEELMLLFEVHDKIKEDLQNETKNLLQSGGLDNLILAFEKEKMRSNIPGQSKAGQKELIFDLIKKEIQEQLSDAIVMTQLADPKTMDNLTKTLKKLLSKKFVNAQEMKNIIRQTFKKALADAKGTNTEKIIYLNTVFRKVMK